MITEQILELLLISLIPAGFGLLFDYCLGRPGSEEINDQAILFSITLFLSKKRLNKIGLLPNIIKMYSGLIEFGENEEEVHEAIKNRNINIVKTANKFFTWERAVGMCLYCSNVWISLIASFITFFTTDLPFFLCLIIPAISHSIIRKF